MFYFIIDSPIAVDHLNVVLTLCSAASLDVRYVAMRKVRNSFLLFLILVFLIFYNLVNDMFHC